MTARIPNQRNRCTRYAWCVVRSTGHRVHQGEARTLTTSSGTELRIALTADAESEPAVVLEATFERGGTMMEIAQIELREAADLADFLLQLARTAPVTRNGVG